jgi:hypothetical protein
VRLPRATATPSAFVAAGFHKGDGPGWGLELQDFTHA